MCCVSKETITEARTLRNHLVLYIRLSPGARHYYFQCSNLFCIFPTHTPAPGRFLFLCTKTLYRAGYRVKGSTQSLLLWRVDVDVHFGRDIKPIASSASGSFKVSLSAAVTGWHASAAATHAGETPDHDGADQDKDNYYDTDYEAGAKTAVASASTAWLNLGNLIGHRKYVLKNKATSPSSCSETCRKLRLASSLFLPYSRFT
jgi:hypothetical protein